MLQCFLMSLIEKITYLILFYQKRCEEFSNSVWDDGTWKIYIFRTLRTEQLLNVSVAICMISVACSMY